MAFNSTSLTGEALLVREALVLAGVEQRLLPTMIEQEPNWVTLWKEESRFGFNVELVQALRQIPALEIVGGAANGRWSEIAVRFVR